MAEKKTQKLSVYLIKDGLNEIEQIINREKCTSEEYELGLSGFDFSSLFVNNNFQKHPEWVGFFKELLNADDVFKKNRSISACLLVKRKGRFFALTFGQGGRFLIKDNAIEEKFGLYAALNSSREDSFRSIDKHSLDAIGSQSRTQSSSPVAPSLLGINAEQDIIKNVVAAPEKAEFGARIAGADSLSIVAKCDLSDLGCLLDEYYEHFQKPLDDDIFDWVNNIALFKDEEITEQLEVALIGKVNNSDFTNLWLSIPEIIDWSEVKGFSYTNAKNTMHTDIKFEDFVKYNEAESLSIENLKTKRVFCLDADSNQTYKKWSVYKCLYAEIDLNGFKYILNDGKWYRIDMEFVSRTNEKFEQAKYSDLTLPEYKDDSEEKYNERVGKENNNIHSVDRDLIPHGGAHGKIEFCDLFSNDNEIIHVKRYGYSSVLSHFFNQGFVSAQLMKMDNDFRAKVKDKLPEPFSSKIAGDSLEASKFSIIFAVISDSEGDELHFPFFSRVTFNHVRMVLESYGYDVYLLKIKVDEIFAVTKTIKAK